MKTKLVLELLVMVMVVVMMRMAKHVALGLWSSGW
jgi:hypothetical protein